MTGAIVRLHLDEFRRLQGEPFVLDILGGLSPQARSEIAGSPIPWVSVDTISTFYDLAAARLDRKVDDLHWEIGRRCVEQTFRTLWRVLLRVTTDEALIGRAPIMFAKTYAQGQLVMTTLGRGAAEMELRDWPDPPAFVTRGLCIGVSTVLRLSGRRSATVVHQPRAGRVLFAAKWVP
jgi:hypothetical protein